MVTLSEGVRIQIQAVCPGINCMLT